MHNKDVIQKPRKLLLIDVTWMPRCKTFLGVLYMIKKSMLRKSLESIYKELISIINIDLDIWRLVLVVGKGLLQSFVD